MPLDWGSYRLILAGLAGLLVVGGLLAWLVGSISGGASRHQPSSLAVQRQQSRVWADLRDVKPLRQATPDPRRLRLCSLDGHQLFNEANRSLTVIAPSGAGKTPRVVVPICLTHQGPAVITSVKADVLTLTAAARAKQGPVLVFDPTESQGPTVRWSPIAGIHTWADALDVARWLKDAAGDHIMSDVENGGYWEAEASHLWAPLVFLAASQGGTMVDVGRMIDPDDTTMGAITDAINTLGDPDAAQYWREFLRTDPRPRASILGTARTMLEAWRHPRIRHAIDVHPGDPDALDLDFITRGAGTLYLVSPAAEQSAFTAVYSCLVNAILMRVELAAQQHGGLPLDPPLLLMLDEAANIAPLPKMDQVASKSAGEGVLLVSVWQDLGQIEKVYGPARARTILSNHYAKIYLPGISDQHTLDTLSAQIGRDLVTTQSSSWSVDGHTRSISEHEELVAPADWLRRLPTGDAIVLVGNYPPIHGRVTAWFEDKHLRDLIDPTVAARFDHQFATRPASRPGLAGVGRMITDGLRRHDLGDVNRSGGEPG